MASKQVHLRVPEKAHDKWDEHVENEGYSSVSDLIRRAVKRQIEADRGELSANDKSAASEPNGRLDDTLAQAEDNGQALERIEEKLTRLQQTVTARGGVSDKELSAVFGAIPESTAGADTEMAGMIEPSNAATPSEIAKEAGVDTEAAAVALSQIRRQYDGVYMSSDPTDEESRYWKVTSLL